MRKKRKKTRIYVAYLEISNQSEAFIIRFSPIPPYKVRIEGL